MIKRLHEREVDGDSRVSSLCARFQDSPTFPHCEASDHRLVCIVSATLKSFSWLPRAHRLCFTHGIWHFDEAMSHEEDHVCSMSWRTGRLSSVSPATNGLSVPCTLKAHGDVHTPSPTKLPVLRLCDATQRHPGGLCREGLKQQQHHRRWVDIGIPKRNLERPL